MEWIISGSLTDLNGLSFTNTFQSPALSGSRHPAIKAINVSIPTAIPRNYRATLALGAPIWTDSINLDLSNAFGANLLLEVSQDCFSMTITTRDPHTLIAALQVACETANETHERITDTLTAILPLPSTSASPPLTVSYPSLVALRNQAQSLTAQKTVGQLGHNAGGFTFK